VRGRLSSSIARSAYNESDSVEAGDSLLHRTASGDLPLSANGTLRLAG
jgi:hypothetical protein